MKIYQLKLYIMEKSNKKHDLPMEYPWDVTFMVDEDSTREMYMTNSEVADFFSEINEKGFSVVTMNNRTDGDPEYEETRIINKDAVIGARFRSRCIKEELKSKKESAEIEATEIEKKKIFAELGEVKKRCINEVMGTSGESA